METVTKREYQLAKAVYRNFYIEPAKGTDTDTVEAFIEGHDPQSGHGKPLGKSQLATLKRCARIIREYEWQNNLIK